MTKSKNQTDETATGDTAPAVAVVRSARATKASGRAVEYHVGRGPGGEALLRLARNDGGGTHSREWVPVLSVREALGQHTLGGEPFRSGSLAKAFLGKSKNNPCFLALALVAEGLAERVPERDGWLRCTPRWDEWERRVRSAQPLPPGSYEEPKRATRRKAKAQEETEGAVEEPGGDLAEDSEAVSGNVVPVPGTPGGDGGHSESGMEERGEAQPEPGQGKRTRGKTRGVTKRGDSGEIPVSPPEETDNSAEADDATSEKTSP
jgi:hypothetical protein